MAHDAINLILEPRKTIGKQVKHLRKEGIVPAVIHDHGKPSLHVQGDSRALLKVWRQAGKHHAIAITAGDKNYTALIKDAAFDPKKHQLTHLVFNAVDQNQKVEAEVPVRPKYAEGNEASPAERAGLIVLAQLENVEVKAIPSSLPDFLEYDGEKLVDVGDHLTVADLVVPSGVEVMTEAEHAIATVYEPSALAAANDAAGGDAEAGDEAAVESEAGNAEGEGVGQASESTPGGKAQKEPSEASVEAAKEDK
jgi:large subunit ribosomal protein L25